MSAILSPASLKVPLVDSVPESATVNEYVFLAGKVAPVRLKGFVNGILRNMIRDNFSKVNLKPNEEVSLPKWLYDMLEEEYGLAYDIGKLSIWDDSLVSFFQHHAGLPIPPPQHPFL